MIIHLIESISRAVLGEIECVASGPSVALDIVSIVDVINGYDRGKSIRLFFFFGPVRKEIYTGFLIVGMCPEFLQLFKEAYPDLKVFETSTLEHKGLDAVLYAAMDCIEEARKTAEENTEEAEDIVVYRYEPKRPDFEIVNLGNGRWKVVSKKVDRLAEQVDFDREDDTYQFALTLQKMGIDAALYEAGARDGDTVIIGTYIMDYTE